MKEKSCDNCAWRGSECYGEEVCEQYQPAEDRGDDAEIRK